jgi:hypothetical protein
VRGWVFRIAAAVSLLLCVGTAVLWVRSYRDRDSWTFVRDGPDYRSVGILSDCGILRLEHVHASKRISEREWEQYAGYEMWIASTHERSMPELVQSVRDQGVAGEVGFSYDVGDAKTVATSTTTWGKMQAMWLRPPRHTRPLPRVRHAHSHADTENDLRHRLNVIPSETLCQADCPPSPPNMTPHIPAEAKTWPASRCPATPRPHPAASPPSPPATPARPPAPATPLPPAGPRPPPPTRPLA